MLDESDIKPALLAQPEPVLGRMEEEEGTMAVVSKGGLKTLNIYFDLGEEALESQRRDPTSRGQKDRLQCLGLPTIFPHPHPPGLPVLMR